MPGMDGLEATRRSRSSSPETKVLIFTAYSERSLLEPRVRVRRQGLRPQGGAARDARARDREGRRGRGLRRPGADAAVPRGPRPERHAHRPRARDPAAARRRPLERRRRRASSSSRRRRSRATSGTSSRSSRPTRARTRWRSRCARRSSIEPRREQRLDRLIAAEQDERRRLALFLHDGPVQQLSGIALMLDGALHSIANGPPRRGARDHRHGARPPARDDPASSATSRSRSSRSCCATTASGRRCARSPTRRWRSHGHRRPTSTLDGADAARRDRAGRALHDHPRADRPVRPPRPADADRRLARRGPTTAA